MDKYIATSIFRYDPDTDISPRYQEYRIEAEGEISVLMLLDRIQKNIDETLSFRSFCCGLQMCRSCLMKINGKKRFACITLVGPGERITIEPVTFPDRHVKDLVVELNDDERRE